MCNAVGSLFRLAIVGGGCLALAFQFGVMFNCDYIQFGKENYASLGPWYYGVGGTCETEEIAVDSDAWLTGSIITAAQSCMILSMLCGFGATVLVTFEWLCCKVCCAGVLEGLGFAGGWACGLAAYGLYGIEACQDTAGFSAWLANELGNNNITNAECVWGSGATFNIIACICWAGCGFLLCCTPQPDPICCK